MYVWGCSPQAASLRNASARRESHRARMAAHHDAATGNNGVCNTCEQAICKPATPMIPIPVPVDNSQRGRSDSMESETSDDEVPLVVGSPPTNLATLPTSKQLHIHQELQKRPEEKGQERGGGEEAKQEEEEDLYSHMSPQLLDTKNITGNISEV